MMRGLLRPFHRRVRTNAGIDDCRRLWTIGSTANRTPRTSGLALLAIRILVRYRTLARNLVRLPERGAQWVTVRTSASELCH